MGHVDHGKTTLLDAIRKTSVVATHGPDATELAAVEGEVDLDVDHPAVAPPHEVPAGIPVEAAHEQESGEDAPAA